MFPESDSPWGNQLNLDDAAVHKAYWLKQFEGDIPVLDLAGNKQQYNDSKKENWAELVITINRDLVNKLENISESLGGTLFIGLLACINLLLYWYSGQEDIVVGSVIPGLENSGPEEEHLLLGLVLALRTRFNAAENYEQFFQKVKDIVLNAGEHWLYPLNELTEALNLRADQKHHPLFDVTVVFRNKIETENFRKNGSSHEPEAAYPGITEGNLNFIFSPSRDGLQLLMKYNLSSYSKGQMDRMLTHFENVIAAVVADSGKAIDEFDILTESDTKYLLHGLNDTTVPYSKDKTIVDLFEEQVQKTPANMAVVFNDITLSYEELNARSNQLADYLKKNYGVKPDDLVGIMLERSEWMIVTIFGILKAGGAYVPIAPDYPQERIDYLVKDSGCKVLIHELELEKFKSSQSEYSTENQSAGIQPGNLAYCIYTSGSTGNPKGCLLQHSGLVNRLEWMQKAYPLKADDVILQKTTFSFDVSVWELIWWAIEGSGVCMLQPRGEKSPEVMVDAIEKYHATVMHFVPSMLSVFLEYLEHDTTSVARLKSLKQVFTSGEALTLNQAERFNRLFPDKSLLNLYGPTEASIDVTYFDCREENLKGFVPIGKPIDNTYIYILNKSGKLIPPGGAGEIYLGGAGLARGYLNRPELTAEKFIANPFIAGERLYKTGDLGRWMPDGNIAYLGRIDDQVKIRGFRVELDEITSVLQKHPMVTDAVAVATALRGEEKELIAYYTGEVPASELRDYLQGLLPAYMVPGFYVRLQSIPLTSNGKVNRKALPIPESTGLNEVEYLAPTSEVEKALAKIWSKVLGTPGDKISVNSNFFDLGGHSIKVARLRGLLHRELSVELSIKDLFSANTMAKQAEAISGKKLKSYETIKAVALQPDYPLSSAQRRLWILNHFEGTEGTYNIPYVISLLGYIDKSALQKALEAMAARHDILRTVFVEDDTGAPRQHIIGFNNYNFKLQETDLTNAVNKEGKLNKLVDQERFGGFDFVEGPLWRCHLIQLGKDKHILLIVHHHIISDGWSMDIFRQELGVLYSAFAKGQTPDLPLLRIQYKDYSAWHTRQLESADIAWHKNYWLKQFEGNIPVLALPADKERPVVKTYNGASITTTIDKEVINSFIKTGNALGGTLFMSLLACVNALLYRYTGQEDIIIGSPMAGREHPDLEGQIGLYINTVALRARFKASESYESLFEQIKEITLSGDEHQLYPYDQLVNALKLPRDTSRNPLFDVMVVLQNSMEQDAEFGLDGLQSSIYEGGDYSVAKFDINFIFSESKRGLDMFLEYNTDIYSTPRIQKMAKEFESIVASVIRDPKQNLNQLDISVKEEKTQMSPKCINNGIEKKNGSLGEAEPAGTKTPATIGFWSKLSAVFKK